MHKKLNNIVQFDSSNQYGLYYYYDISEFKVRSIFLNSIDIPYIFIESNPNVWEYDGQNTYAYVYKKLKVHF